MTARERIYLSFTCVLYTFIMGSLISIELNPNSTGICRGSYDEFKTGINDRCLSYVFLLCTQVGVFGCGCLVSLHSIKFLDKLGRHCRNSKEGIHCFRYFFFYVIMPIFFTATMILGFVDKIMLGSVADNLIPEIIMSSVYLFIIILRHARELICR
jgi:hypothetical protein